MGAIHYLDDLIRAQNLGEALGIVSICPANPYVIEASFQHALRVGSPVLIESTCNQVNQFGGYTGISPE
jgi:D-tagatose-1,6-bisphosphate aldolase subunit GatZ/KbaZ